MCLLYINQDPFTVVLDNEMKHVIQYSFLLFPHIVLTLGELFTEAPYVNHQQMSQQQHNQPTNLADPPVCYSSPARPSSHLLPPSLL